MSVDIQRRLVLIKAEAGIDPRGLSDTLSWDILYLGARRKGQVVQMQLHLLSRGNASQKVCREGRTETYLTAWRYPSRLFKSSILFAGTSRRYRGPNHSKYSLNGKSRDISF